MLRRLCHDQPESFAFTPGNRAWAEAQVGKFPDGRQASAIIPLLWRAQEQEGWLSRPAIEHVADLLGLAHIRALEVATFYFMFQLQPVGSLANIQVCGTTSCMICGAGDLIAVCKEKIAPRPHTLSPDGRFSWEEVECLGACANAPMAQIGKDYYEDLTPERLAEIIDTFAAGDVPVPGPQGGRYASEPDGTLTSLTAHREGRPAHNASIELALQLGDTVKRIDGSEAPLRDPGRTAAAQDGEQEGEQEGAAKDDAARADETPPKDMELETNLDRRTDLDQEAIGRPDEGAVAPRPENDPYAVREPRRLDAARGGKGDDLTRIRGIGPELRDTLHEMGIWHFDQIAAWGPAEIGWMDDNLEGSRGQVARDDWVAQARALGENGGT